MSICTPHPSFAQYTHPLNAGTVVVHGGCVVKRRRLDAYWEPVMTTFEKKAKESDENIYETSM